MIQVKNVTKEFDGFRALDHVNMHVGKGEIYGLVGRFSKVGEEAFYRFYLPIDDTIQKALE